MHSLRDAVPAFDRRRKVLWQALVTYFFQRDIFPEYAVLEIGSGYGDFINSVRCAKKYAVDAWAGAGKYLNPDITFLHRNAWDLAGIQDHSIDYVFASNVFEHLTHRQLASTIRELTRKVRPGGLLVILQPNFRYAFRDYFNDFTHKTIYTDIGLRGYLSHLGLEPVEVRSRFLPFSINSRFPVVPFLIWLYLKLPFKPFARQMLLKMRIPMVQNTLASLKSGPPGIP